MKVHERKQALLQWLGERESATASEAAQALGVSLRTLNRDISQLRLEGYSIQGNPGRTGGLSFQARGRLPSIELDAGEAVSTYLSLHYAMRAGVPHSRGVESTLSKIGASIPDRRLEELERWLERVVEGGAATQDQGSNPISAKLVELLEESFRLGHALRFDDRDSKKGSRTFEVHGLEFRGTAWFLVGCAIGESDSLERVELSRIGNPRVLKSVEFEPLELEEFQASL